jgi:penicillin-binding protein 1A
LPIFADFIKRVYNEPKLGITQKDQFPIPVGAVSYDCDESDVHSPASQMRDDEFFD